MQRVIQSDAFRGAALKSERYRIIGILAIVAAFMLLNIVRSLTWEFTAKDIERAIVYMTFWVVVGGFEGIMLWVVTRALRRGRGVASWVWVMNTVVECSFPTIAILGQTGDKSYLGPYLALSSGAMLIYACFIILSTLRLSPWLCVLAGIVSGAGYEGMYLFTLWVAPTNPNRKIYRPETFIINGGLLLGCGVLAAAVAWQIRKHVVAALAEAETRRKLDRMEHDIQIARSIQKGLLPKNPPVVAGYDIAGWSEPADQTGGDYYDWLELPGGRVLFTIADATGHGIGPALLVTACRAYFRAIAMRDDPLEKITAQVDELIARDCPDGRFITAAVALLEPEQHRLSIFSAGHGPIYFYSARDKRVAEWDADQPPLGIQFGTDVNSQARLIAMEPGDALVLVTDGFFECGNGAGELLGTEKLGEMILENAHYAADEIIQQLYKGTVTFSAGTEQGDDITGVVIKRR